MGYRNKPGVRNPFCHEAYVWEGCSEWRDNKLKRLVNLYNVRGNKCYRGKKRGKGLGSAGYRTLFTMAVGLLNLFIQQTFIE